MAGQALRKYQNPYFQAIDDRGRRNNPTSDWPWWCRALIKMRCKFDFDFQTRNRWQVFRKEQGMYLWAHNVGTTYLRSRTSVLRLAQPLRRDANWFGHSCNTHTHSLTHLEHKQQVAKFDWLLHLWNQRYTLLSSASKLLWTFMQHPHTLIHFWAQTSKNLQKVGVWSWFACAPAESKEWLQRRGKLQSIVFEIDDALVTWYKQMI